MPSTCSGSSTSASSLRKRVANSSVFPEPAGARTRIEDVVSSASSRALRSASSGSETSTIGHTLCDVFAFLVVFYVTLAERFRNPAEPRQRAIPAGLWILLRLDGRVAGQELLRQIAQGLRPFVQCVLSERVAYKSRPLLDV